MSSTKTLGIGRGKDIYKVPFELIIFEPNKNGRIDYGDIEGLALSILENGQKQPIYATKIGNTPETVRYVLRDGFRRYKAVEYIRNILQEPFPTMLVITTERNYTEIDGLFEQIVSNDSKPFNMLEEGNVYRALSSQGAIESTIAKRVGKSYQHIKNCLILAELPPSIKAYIISEQISCTLMLQLAREYVDYEELEQIIKQRLSVKEIETTKPQTSLPFSGDGTIDTESEYNLPAPPEKKCKLTKKDFEFNENNSDSDTQPKEKESYSGEISESPIIAFETSINVCHARGIGSKEDLQLASKILANMKAGSSVEGFVKCFIK
jgi:ParB/RepB/Spo0J family partition protein